MVKDSLRFNLIACCKNNFHRKSLDRTAALLKTWRAAQVSTKGFDCCELYPFRSGVDFTVVRDSVILLERKPLPRLHLTTGATALLECKVIHVVLISLLFVILECGRVGLWQGG